MSIAPIIRSVRVKAAPARAFDVFTTQMAQWWPKGGTLSKSPHVAIVIEPWPEGRWFEQDAEGRETQWGKVLKWEPPTRLLLGWQISCDWAYDPNLLTEVELTFAAADSGGTVVTLEHRNLERFGSQAAAHAEKLRGGWPSRVTAFAEYADARS